MPAPILRARFEQTGDTSQVLGRLASRLPGAVRGALNSTAFEVQKKLREHIPRAFDRPVPGVVRAVQTDRATQQRPTEAYILFTNRSDPAFANRLARLGLLQELGGTSTPAMFNRKKFGVPTSNVTLNAYGNMRRGQARRLAARRTTFFATIGGVRGLFERGRGRANHNALKLLIVTKRKLHYRPRFRFVQTADMHARRLFPAALESQLRRIVQRAGGSV